MEQCMSEGVLALKEAKRVALWTFGVLTSLVATLALVALVRRAVDVRSLGAPLDSVMAAYAATAQLALGWAEPYLQALVASVNSHLNLHLTLHPYWTDAFVLFAVYGAGHARACFISSEPKLSLGFVVRQVMLVVAVLFAALVVGVLPLRSEDTVTQLAIFGLPVGMYSFSFENWHDFVQTLLSAFYLVCMAAVSAWLFGDSFGFGEGLGFWSLALWVLGSGMTLIVQGLISNEHRYAWVPAGLVIVGGFVGAACLFAVEASLKLLAV
jgi:hypothetical protein